MELAPEKKLEDMLNSYLKENQGKAFTIEALRKRFEAFTLDPQIREYSKENLLTVLNKMRDNGKIKLTQHEGKTYYFIPEIYDSTQYELDKTHFIVPEKFISAELGKKKKVKKKYCKNCKKEVILEYRRPEIIPGRDHKVRHRLSFWFDWFESLRYTLRHRFSKMGIEARRNTGWFCPVCNERLAVLYREVKIITYLSFVILTGFLITSTIFTGGELQTILFALAIFFSVMTILITVRQLIRVILKKRGRKILDKMKDKPKEYLDRYMKKSG